MKTTNSDIVDIILGQASADSEDRMGQAIESDAELAARYSMWRDVLEATRAAAVEEQAMQQRAMSAVMGYKRRSRSVAVGGAV